MRNFVVRSIAILAMAGTACNKEPKQPPKELTVDLRGGVKMELVLIPAGEFIMGSPKPVNRALDFKAISEQQHRVRITKPFYLGKYLVR